MATPIIIFPSLSKAPSLDTGQNTADDTIRDPMDLGYVATRPRFSRRRRTWTQNVRNLLLEDVRALDEFTDLTVQGGAQSFYYPNLVPNGSFEFPAESPAELVKGWSVGQVALCSVAPCSNATDGNTAIQFQSVAGTLAAGANLTANLQSTKAFFPTSGEAYQAVFQMAPTVLGFSGCPAVFSLQLVLQLSDGSETAYNFSPLLNLGGGPGYAAYSQTITIPTPSAGLTIAAAYVRFSVSLTNTTGSALAVSATDTGNYLSVCFDAVGLALITPAPGASIYGRMVGSSSLPFPVRFAANKLPTFSDLGFGDGVKRYGTTFDLEEV